MQYYADSNIYRYEHGSFLGRFGGFNILNIVNKDFEIVQKQDEIDIGDIQETEIKNDGINYYEYKNNGATESGYSKNYSVNDIETRLKINELVQALKQLDKRVRKLED